MRWPLRRQILLPMVSVVLAAVLVVSLLNAYLASKQVIADVDEQQSNVARTLAATNFPLERNVLRQTRGLTGAEYLISSDDSVALAASDDGLLSLSAANLAAQGASQSLDVSLAEGTVEMIHIQGIVDRRAVGGSKLQLHAFYPAKAWRAARWQATWPPLAIGAVAVALTIAAAYVVALRVTGPIDQLQKQVKQIAAGDYQQMPATGSDDEVHQLAQAINQMAQRLADYEEEIRRSERLRTLGQLGGGIAHQVRNAATGCRLALDLLERDLQLAGVCNSSQQESLDVATQQLALIESYVQRLLSLGRSETQQHQAIDLSQLLTQLVPLVLPTARHLGIEIQCSVGNHPVIVNGDTASLQQMVINLIINAIEAAADRRTLSGNGVVQMRLNASDSSHTEIEIVDNGAGVSEFAASRMFEPFATDKPQGTGLGLCVARKTAEAHRGSIRWSREQDQTHFFVTLPLATSDVPHGETAGSR